MLVSARLLVCALGAGLFVMAGCATKFPANRRHVPDWQAEDAEPNPATAPQAAAVVREPQSPAAPAVAAVTNVPAPPSTSLQRLPTATTAPPREKWVSLPQWCKEHQLPAPQPISGAPEPGFSISASNSVFTFRVGTTIASWQGIQLWLGFAPRLIDHQPCLHWLDLQKNVLPLLAGNNAAPPLTGVAVIDPGHGGEDAGTRSVIGRGYEKDYTLDWARRLAGLLESNGWTVLLTRTNDADLSLSNRVAFTELHHADIFISLHFNSSAPDETQYGLETYCLTPIGMPSTVTRGFGDEIAVSFPNNAYDANNLELAIRAHKALLEVNGHRDRGVRRARFLGVLRNQHRPAVLIEGGYLSNHGEATLIGTAAHRQKLAEALATAIGQAHQTLAQSREAATPAAVESAQQSGVSIPAQREQ